MCKESQFSKEGGKFGKNKKEFKDLTKQCWCEPEPEYEPYHCSADGGQCSCKNGNVFYGIKNVPGTDRIASWDDVSVNDMAVVEANKTDYVECSPESFGDTDPQPGIEKECYCDDRKKVD